jgi:hypothetical protein
MLPSGGNSRGYLASSRFTNHTYYIPRYGLWRGVGRGLAVGVALGVDVGVGVAVAVAVAVGVALITGVAVAVAVAVAVGVGDAPQGLTGQLKIPIPATMAPPVS